VGLTDWMSRLAGRRLHVLPLEQPGGLRVRLTVEAGCARRGWPVVVAPSDADVLVVCGGSAAEILDESISMIMDQVPAPSSRIDVERPTDVDASLDRVAREHLEAARTLPAGNLPGTTTLSDHQDQQPDHSDHDMSSMGGHGDHDMSGMSGHDHHMMMGGPGGIPLAGGARGRDGLEMDVLHLRLGPALNSWPAGLIATLSLQGDVVTEVTTETVSWTGPDEQPYLDDQPAVRRLDATRQLLLLAGAEGPAARLQRIGAELLHATPPSTAAAELDQVHHRLSRAPVLRWNLTKLGLITAEDVHRCGWPASWQGDVHTRLLSLLRSAAEALRDPDPEPASEVDAELTMIASALPRLLVDLELASARLVVASLWGQDQIPVGARPRRAPLQAM
jgi:hypothetical protein